MTVWVNEILRRLFICPGSAINHWGTAIPAPPWVTVTGIIFTKVQHTGRFINGLLCRPDFFALFSGEIKPDCAKPCPDKQEGKGDGKMAEAAQTTGHRLPQMPAKIAKNIIGAYPRR